VKAPRLGARGVILKDSAIEVCETPLSTIFDKLAVSGRLEPVLFALKHELVSRS